MRDAVLVMEAGVSTVRFAVLDTTGADIGDYALRGELTGLYGRARFRVRDVGGHLLADIDCADELPPGHEIGLDFLFNWLRCHAPELSVRAVGHRLTDDGALFGGPVRVDAAVLERLAALAGARRRERMVLATLRSLARRRPGLPQVACFETAFHARMPRLARLFDRRTMRRQLHAYRHGLTYEALMEQLAAVDDRAVRGRTIAVLLDQRIALCAVFAGRSVAATPGFDLGPPGKGRAPGRVRPLPPAATRFVLYRVRRDMGSLAAAMGGVDAVAFATGGDRRAAALRPRILGDAAWLGVESDPAAAAGPRLTRPRSRVAAWLVHADPTRVIARHTLKVLGG